MEDVQEEVQEGERRQRKGEGADVPHSALPGQHLGNDEDGYGRDDYAAQLGREDDEDREERR